MDIASISYASGMTERATNMVNNRTRADVATKVLEQIQDQEQIMATALVDMIEQSPLSPDGVGEIVDLRV